MGRGGQGGKTYPNLSISLQVFCKSVKVADKAVGGQYTFMYRDTRHTVNSDSHHNYSDSQHYLHCPSVTDIPYTPATYIRTYTHCKLS